MPTNSEPSFWNSDQVKAVFRADEPEETTLHPHLARIIQRLAPRRLLDYGCGDGALLSVLDPSIEIGLYDPNLESARVAGKKSHAAVTHLYERADAIPAGSYDVAVLSFVLICLPDEAAFRQVLENIQRGLRAGGTLLIVEGHPCFRDRPFAGHYVAYSPARPFDYNDRHHLFPICLRSATEEVQFFDYHWRISDIVNTVLQSGFQLSALEEISDGDYGARTANPFFPPYLTLLAKKLSL